MRLYCFDGGKVIGKKSMFISGGGSDPFAPPIPFYLIKHKCGNVLFDTGLNGNLLSKDPQVRRAHYNTGLLDVLDVSIDEEQYAPNAIKMVGLEPEDIDFIICSHLHHDHAGSLKAFPNATVILQQAEWDYARKPYSFNKGFIKSEYEDLPDLYLLHGERDNRFDLFRDGSLIIYYTPGHTIGHQSLLVNTEHSGSFFLAADAVYIRDNLDQLTLPGGAVHSGIDYMNTLRTVRFLEKCGVKIIPGHDPKQFVQLRHAPEYYN